MTKTSAATTKDPSGPAAAPETSWRRSGEREPAVLVDNRPEAAAQRDLQVLADTGPRGRNLQALQLMADRWADRRSGDNLSDLSPLRAPAGAATPVQLKIDPGKPEFAGRRVRQGKRIGVIVRVSGRKYEVKFEINDKSQTKAVEAGLLDFADDPAPPSANEAKGEVDVDDDDAAEPITDAGPATSSTGKPSGATDRPEALPEPEADSEGAPPAWLRVEQTDRNAWTLTLLDAGLDPLAKIEGVKKPQLAEYVPGGAPDDKRTAAGRLEAAEKKKLKDPSSTADTKRLDGEKWYVWTRGTAVPGKLGQEYGKLLAERGRAAAFEKFRKGHTAPPDDLRPRARQSELFDRLKDLDTNKDTSRPGNKTLPMTKITLLRPIRLMVGGAARLITHLYTQPGNSTEIRCYLGNGEGAFQRVHTSLTKGAKMSSHTMVQTGELVATPGNDRQGVRVGFESDETTGQGFAQGALKERDPRRTKVDNPSGFRLDAEDFKALSVEKYSDRKDLAKRFNVALDEALADINEGDVGNRLVALNSESFKTLDDEWLYEEPGKKAQAATPDLEGMLSRRAALEAAESSNASSSAPPPGGQPEGVGSGQGAPKGSASNTDGQEKAAREAYDRDLEHIRGTVVAAPVPQQGVTGLVYARYPLSAAQVEALGSRRLLPTVPDGDCSINAVLESAGLTFHPSEIRDRIAGTATEDYGLDERAADEIRDAGDWTRSDVVLPAIARLLGLSVVVIEEDGMRLPPLGPGNAKQQVVLFHVRGLAGADHFYGSL